MAIAWDLMVIPFSRSRSMLSSTCSFILPRGMVSVISSSRSASVDFPWSMCAMMQKFRTSERGIMGGLEPGPVGEGEAGLLAHVHTRFGRAEVGVERGQVGVHVGVHRGEEVRRDPPPDPVDLTVPVNLLVQRGLLVGGVGDVAAAVQDLGLPVQGLVLLLELAQRLEYQEALHAHDKARLEVLVIRDLPPARDRGRAEHHAEGLRPVRRIRTRRSTARGRLRHGRGTVSYT